MSYSLSLPRRWPRQTRTPSAVQGERVLLDVFIMLTMMVSFVAWLGLLREGRLVQHAEVQQDTIGRLTGTVSKLEQQGLALHGEIKKLQTTPAGKFAVDEMLARKDLQKMKLLVVWGEYLRKELALAKLIRQLENVSRINLMEEHGWLPKDDTFTSLQAECKEMFLAQGHERGVSPGRANKLLAEVRLRAGFTEDGLRKGVANAGLAVFGRGELFHPDVLHEDNVRYLEVKIRQDLMEERGKMELLQLRLIEEVLTARLNNFGSDAVQSDQRQQSSNPREQFERLLAELDRPLSLLPEVAEQLRAGLH